jgi:hypothetical protein
MKLDTIMCIRGDSNYPAAETHAVHMPIGAALYRKTARLLVPCQGLIRFTGKRDKKFVCKQLMNSLYDYICGLLMPDRFHNGNTINNEIIDNE